MVGDSTEKAICQGCRTEYRYIRRHYINIKELWRIQALTFRPTIHCFAGLHFRGVNSWISYRILLTQRGTPTTLYSSHTSHAYLFFMGKRVLQLPWQQRANRSWRHERYRATQHTHWYPHRVPSEW